MKDLDYEYTDKNNPESEKMAFYKGAFARISELIMNDQAPGDIKKRQVNHVEVLASHFVTKAYGLIGFPKFLDGHYLYLITKKKKVGTLLKETVYQVEEVVLEMILNKEMSCLNQLGGLKNDEIRYSFYEMRCFWNKLMNFFV